MKYKASDIFEGINGRLSEDFTLANYRDLIQVRGQKMHGVIRKIGKKKRVRTFRNENLKTMFKLAIQTWKSYEQTIRDNWSSFARTFLSGGYVVKSGFQLYMGHILTLYAETYSLYVIPKEIKIPQGQKPVYLNSRLLTIKGRAI